MSGCTSATVSSAITLNPTTSTTVVSANDLRGFFRVYNGGSVGAWLKLQTAATDNDKKGIYLAAGESWQMQEGLLYLGAISAIAAADAPDVYYTEY